MVTKKLFMDSKGLLSYFFSIMSVALMKVRMNHSVIPAQSHDVIYSASKVPELHLCNEAVYI